MTALDNARNSGLARAFGATPGQVAAGLTVASLLALMPATLLVVAVPAAIPSRIAGRRPAMDALRTD